ncbi:hydrogenase expression/formation protein HypE [Bradyrhizobium japonicum]|nr:hydrogenase expression/formation protein HypE [Bradyrhizobium japonicum]
MTTDGYVISPLFFPGGNIGSLAVHGTINDIAMSGARPLYLSASFIIEEGFRFSDLKTIAESMGAAACAAGVYIIAGDTKVVERGKADGLFISMTGIGLVADGSIFPLTRQRSGTVCCCPVASVIMGWRSCQSVRTLHFKPKSSPTQQRCIVSLRPWLPLAVAASG